jgi:Mg2+-importing ATPase
MTLYNLEDVNTETLKTYWSVPLENLLMLLDTKPEGLSNEEVQKRIIKYGLNLLKSKKRKGTITLLLLQFKSPIILLLLFSSILSFFLGDPTDGSIIIIILLFSNFLGFWQERKASNAIYDLLAKVQVVASVMRGGMKQDVSVEEIVPGDIVLLSAGKMVPGDSIIIESKDLFTNEATLTGETFPAEKYKGVVPSDTPMSQRKNVLYMGTNVVSGNAKALVVQTGKKTEFGKISEHLKLRPMETEFERGIRRFGYLLLEITLIMLFAIFLSNVLLNHPLLDSFLFSLALAIGLTPQLLPAIISITLSKGAKKMAEKKVIIRRLDSIENFGNMNILCSDKTGTLTEGIVTVNDILDINGIKSEKASLFAYINAYYQTAYMNPIDEALVKYKPYDLANIMKLDEIPYDFIRKKLSVAISLDQKNILITKGALQNVLDICTFVEKFNGEINNLENLTEQIIEKYTDLSNSGYRVLGIAYKEITPAQLITRDDENAMIFLGFLVFYDPPKSSLIETIQNLNKLNLRIKIITGDNNLVASNVMQNLGLRNPILITGQELRRISDEALSKMVDSVDIFAEVEPNQKERIIIALKKTGNVVGYIGDGINDVSALHAADVGISVDTAIDVAKDTADIVLLEKDLNVLIDGIKEGRVTFTNTIKYIFNTTSASFGNMFSMAGSSLFLPFLPLLPEQVLLNNLLSDLPAVNIATDNVDQEQVIVPRKWNIKFVRRFMVIFGITSSLMDFVTFFILLFIFSASVTQFRTAWFIESTLTELFIIFIIRTRKRFYKSRPSKNLLIYSILVAIFTIFFPYLPLNSFLGFTPLPFVYMIAIILITISYIFLTELVKFFFYKKYQF